jgi:hypothetical protein
MKVNLNKMWKNRDVKREAQLNNEIIKKRNILKEEEPKIIEIKAYGIEQELSNIAYKLDLVALHKCNSGLNILEIAIIILLMVLVHNFFKL